MVHSLETLEKLNKIATLDARKHDPAASLTERRAFLFAKFKDKGVLHTYYALEKVDIALLPAVTGKQLKGSLDEREVVVYDEAIFAES